MGIDFSHCDANCGYGTFNKLRTVLAETIGISLKNMVGFGGVLPWPDVHGLEPFLDHSDSDGDLKVDELKIVIPALKIAIATDTFKQNSEFLRYNYVILEIIEGMECALKNNEPFEFL